MSVAMTSIDAHNAIGLRGRKTANDQVFDVVADLCRRGVRDLTNREIGDAFNERYNRFVSDGWISARVTELVAAERLVRPEGITRKSSHKPYPGEDESRRKEVLVVTVPYKQARLLA